MFGQINRNATKQRGKRGKSVLEPAIVSGTYSPIGRRVTCCQPSQLKVLIVQVFNCFNVRPYNKILNSCKYVHPLQIYYLNYLYIWSKIIKQYGTIYRRSSRTCNTQMFSLFFYAFWKHFRYTEACVNFTRRQIHPSSLKILKRPAWLCCPMCVYYA